MWLESLPEEKRVEETTKDAERQVKFAARFADAEAAVTAPQGAQSDGDLVMSPPQTTGLLQRMRAGLKSPGPAVAPERTLGPKS